MLAPCLRPRLALVLEAGAKHAAALEEVPTGVKKRERRQMHAGSLPDGPLQKPGLSSSAIRKFERPRTAVPLHPDMPKPERQRAVGPKTIAALERRAEEAREAEEAARQEAQQAMVARMLADAEVEAALAKLSM
jgi:hypothetical protein